MRFFCRLPPLSRVLWLVGLLALLASLAIGTLVYWPLPGSREFIEGRGRALSPPLGMLGFALTSLALFFGTRHGSQVSRPAQWLGRWPGQLLAALVLAALPTVTLVIVLVTPPNSSLFMVHLFLNVLSAAVLFAAAIAGLVLAAL